MRKTGLGILSRVLGVRKEQPRPGLKLVVGLGNPGKKYSATRHNVGFWCVEHLAEESAITFSQRRRHAVIGEGAIAGIPVALAKPRTFVNESGQAIAFLLARYRASPADLLVVYDDMDLPPGALRLRPRGGSGGHKGMKSVIGAVGSQDISRLRIGIGRPPPGVDDVEHVLGTMPPEERKKTDQAVARAVQAVICMLEEGISVAMERFN